MTWKPERECVGCLFDGKRYFDHYQIDSPNSFIKSWETKLTKNCTNILHSLFRFAARIIFSINLKRSHYIGAKTSLVSNSLVWSLLILTELLVSLKVSLVSCSVLMGFYIQAYRWQAAPFHAISDKFKNRRRDWPFHKGLFQELAHNENPVNDWFTKFEANSRKNYQYFSSIIHINLKQFGAFCLWKAHCFNKGPSVEYQPIKWYYGGHNLKRNIVLNLFILYKQI